MGKLVQDLLFEEEVVALVEDVAAQGPLLKTGGKVAVCAGTVAGTQDGVRAHPKAQMVRVAPGVHGWVPGDAAAKVAEYVLCRWSKQRDGSYAPVPVGGTWAKLTPGLCETLGFAGGLDTIKRLAVAGFVDASQISPGVMLLDLDSWTRHLVACMDDVDRWAEGTEDLKEYLWKNGLRHEE